jgi:hypothetical protein
MKVRLVSFILIIFFICTAMPSCNQSPKEDTEVLKSKLNYAIVEADPLEAAKLLQILKDRGVDPKELPVTEIAHLIWSKGYHACRDERDLVLLFGPLEGLVDNTWLEYPIRGTYFWGLMNNGQRKKALELWEKSEMIFQWRWEETRYYFDRWVLPRKDPRNQTNLGSALHSFAYGFLSSSLKEDNLRAVEIAKKDYDWTLSSVNEDTDDFQSFYPMTRIQKMQLMSDSAYSFLTYCLVESKLADDNHLNPFLESQPQTDIKFELVTDAGFEASPHRKTYSGNRIGSIDPCRQIVLGDIDNDNYIDVFIPTQGLWRNLAGNGRFDRVDKSYVIDIHGECGALADVNNDGYMDILTASPNRFDVLLQTQSKIFRPVLNASNTNAEKPRAIGLFDGDADGFIDIYLASYVGRCSSHGPQGTADVVFRNNGDGTFVDVTEAWNFKENDIMYCGAGVSPADYDDDGYTDVFVSNYGMMPNTLWHNSFENHKLLFIQCADSPLFNRKIPLGISQAEQTSVAGIFSTIARTLSTKAPNKTWGHTMGSVWGDLNADGTLDLVCANFAHPMPVYRGYSDISHVYLNTGNAFKDYSLDAGLVYRETVSDPLLADFDNDGHLDLSIVNDYSIYVNQFYEGVGDGSFNDVTFRTGAFACNTEWQASGDFDNDGDLDWFVFDGNKGMLVYENKLIDDGITPQAANWIQLKLHGGKSVNTMAYGVRVTVKAGAKQYVREVAGMRGNSNCDDQVIHVGLGNYTGKVDVEVRWIGDKLQKVNGLSINKRHQIYEDYEVKK